MPLFVPDYMRKTVYDIEFSLFDDLGTKLIFFDIDNTLVSYDTAKPTPENAVWFNALKERGIGIVFLSNNEEERVRGYAQELGYPYYAKVHKPFCHYHRLAAKCFGVKRKQCLLIGDQIFTDVLSAHLFGCRTVMVDSIKPVETTFFRIKKACEIPFVAFYRRRHPTAKGEESQ